MTNTLNTPIEAMELAYPLRALVYELRTGSGGVGRHRGGDGVRRVIEVRAPCTVTLMTERRRLAPWGLQGGGSARRGRNRVRRADAWASVGGKATLELDPGDAISVESPGGGGWGRD